MARIVVLTHPFDEFSSGEYLLQALIRHWRSAGHSVRIASEPDAWPDGDVAILHVDQSVVPALFTAARQRYRAVINGDALDIRKSVVSRHVIKRDDAWTGPVIVKTDLNCGGIPEYMIGQRAQRAGRADVAPHGQVVWTERPYPIFAAPSAVPDAMWKNPGLVVERFLPEQDERGYWMRVWIFFGDRERCGRFLGNHPIVKSGNIFAREPAPVPPELRAERARLGFDFGKFDFVVHDGQVVLFDANRTPGQPPAAMRAELESANAELARGIERWLGG